MEKRFSPASLMEPRKLSRPRISVTFTSFSAWSRGAPVLAAGAPPPPKSAVSSPRRMSAWLDPDRASVCA